MSKKKSGKTAEATPKSPKSPKASPPSVQEMLSDLTSCCASSAYIDRALGLKFGTAEKWKAGNKLTASELALLRLIHTYPWMLDVADNRFDAGVANAYVVAAAGAEMLATAKEKARK